MAPKQIVAFGECMLEVQANGFGAGFLSYGGDTFNTAVYLRRCSRPEDLTVAYACGLGDDGLSIRLMQEWSSQGLDLKYLRQVAGKLPGIYLIETDQSGERSFQFWRENSAARAYFEIEMTPLEQQSDQIDSLYFSGISLAILDQASRQRFFDFLGKLKATGKQVIFDNNYRPRLWADQRITQSVFLQAFSMATTALVTLEDHQAVFSIALAADAIAHVKQLPSPEIVIKRGMAPTQVRAANSYDWIEVPTYPVQQVVDTTAAGDSFAGAYLSRRLLGQSASQAADFGNRLAAQVIQHRGAIMPLNAMHEFAP